MKSEDPEVIQLELKYCERCGALWLRMQRGAGNLLRSVRSGSAGSARAAQDRQPSRGCREITRSKAKRSRADLSAIYGQGGTA